MGQIIETEATILDVADDATWKYSIEADIPAFDGERSYKYLAWNKKQGPPPQVGAVGIATFESYQRAKYYVDRGDIEAGPVDGTEMHYQVVWNIMAFSTGAASGAGGGLTPSPTPKTPLSASQEPPRTAGPTFLAVPTAADRSAKDIAKFRRESEGVNDRKAVSDVLAMVEPGAYTLDGLLEDASKLAAWYNTRLAARCESPLVQAASEQGAVVTHVSNLDDPVDEEPRTGAQAVKNKAELSDWVAEKGWSKAMIGNVLKAAGHADSSAYLAADGNTVNGLAELLEQELGW